MRAGRRLIFAAIVGMLFLAGCGKKIDIKNDFGNNEEQKLSVTTTAEPLPTETVAAETNVPLLKTSEQDLIINLTPNMYTYDDMVYDIGQLAKLYGGTVSCSELCNTADGRVVHDLIVGNPNSGNGMIIVGAMHAREYITTQVVMRQLCSCIDAINGFGGEYKGVPTKELLENTVIHFIPMSNPDGVTISQLGAEGLKSDDLKTSIVSMTNDYEQWKANARGVDLNRNFDAGWDEYSGSSRPSPERYKGTAPGSENEADALIKLTQSAGIKRTISYHTCGALIYWYYKQEGDVRERSLGFARAISNVTGYPLDSDYTAVDAAGYKDWAVYRLGIPSLTIEVGNETGRGIINPVPISQFDAIWQRNRDVPFAAAYNLQYEV